MVQTGRCPYHSGVQVVKIPVVAQLLLDTVIDVPVVQVVQLPSSFTRRGAEAFPWSRLFVGPSRFPVAPQHGDRCPSCAGRAGHSCRGAEADPRGLVGHGDSQSPWCAGRASSTGAVVEATVVLLQLHLS